jgi:chorismate dehydratase
MGVAGGEPAEQRRGRRVNWRIGSVPYLNVRPLIYGIEDRVAQCEPSRLADFLYRGQFEVGMVPIAEVLLHDRYDVLDRIAIASDGAVRSVLLFHRQPIAALRRVAVHTASRTSVMLLRILLKLAYRSEPEFYPRPAGAKLSDHEAMLLIGDDAIWYSLRERDPGIGVLDLGEAWRALTGLPFVYAAWAGQRGVFEDAGLRELLWAAKANGLAHLEEIVQDATEVAPEFLRQYYAQHVRYDLGVREKEAVRRFQQHAGEMGLIPASHDLRYIG